jgi:tetratricopeptide (TPR) repeat protein
MTGKELHSQAEQAREKGDFAQAMTLISQVLIAYAEEKNEPGFAEALASQTLTLRHLWEKTGFGPYLRLALHSSLAGVEALEQAGDKAALVIPYHTVGKVYEALGEHDQAVSWHQKAVDIVDQLPAQHNRPGYKAEIVGHLQTTQLMTGDEAAYPKLLETIKTLESSDEMAYNKDVWLSGMHMAAAEGLAKLNKVSEAKEHLDKAEAIVKANPDLKLRASQLEKLKTKLEL